VLCLDAATGERIYQERFPGAPATPVEPPGGEGGGRFRGGRGGRGGQDYASPILVGDKLILVTRSGLTHVWQEGPEFKSIATNQFASDTTKFNATPAVADDRLYIRSDKAIYCVTAK
jgi:outer membrane protein assembly factor BamB